MPCPWPKEPGGLQCTGSQSVGCGWARPVCRMSTVSPPAGRWNLAFKAYHPLSHKSFPQPPPVFPWRDIPFFLLALLHVCSFRLCLFVQLPSSAVIFHQIIFSRMPFSHLFLFRSSWCQSSFNSLLLPCTVFVMFSQTGFLASVLFFPS